MLTILQILLAVLGLGLVLSANFLFHSIIHEANERLEPSRRFSAQDARPKAFEIMAAHRANCPESQLRTAVWALTIVGFACVLAVFFLQLGR